MWPCASSDGATATLRACIAPSRGAAHDSSAAAAYAVAATQRRVSALSRRLREAQHPFRACVTASQTNQRMWPPLPPADDDDVCSTCCCSWCCGSERRLRPPCDAVLLPDVSLALSHGAHTQLPPACVAVPGHALAPLLDYLARRAAAARSPTSTSVAQASLRHLVVLPSLSSPMSVRDVLARLTQSSPAVTSALCGLSIVSAQQHVSRYNAHARDADDNDDDDETGGSTGRALLSLLTATTQLTYLCLTHCNLRHALRPTLRALRTREVAHVHLAGNDLAQADDAVDALARLLRRNKFLLTLDVSSNGLDAHAVALLARALATSNTTLTPDDVASSHGDTDKSSGSDDEGGDGDEGDDSDEHETDKQDAAATTRAPDDDDTWAEQLLLRDAFVPCVRDDDGDDSDGTSESSSSNDADDNDEDDDEQEHDDRAPYDDDDDDDDTHSQHSDDDDGEHAAQTDDDDDDDVAAARLARAATAREQAERRAARQHARAQRHCVRVFVRREAEARRTLLLHYVDTTRDVVVAGLGAVRACARAEQQRATAAFCARRSGWSRLQSLSLRDNAVGDDGARAVARALRGSVALTSRERATQSSLLRTRTAALCNALVAARRATRVCEARARAQLQRDAATQLRHMQRQATSTAVVSFVPDDADDADDDDEFADAAPQVVLTNIDGSTDTVDDNNNSDDDDRVHANDNADDDDEEDAELRVPVDAWQIALPVTTRPGWCALRHLDLGSCGMASRGLAALARVLAANTTLQRLVLRHNPLTRQTRHVADAHKDNNNNNDDDDDDDDDTCASEVTDATAAAASPCDGVAALAAALRHNTSLCALDMAYCQLEATHVRALADALQHNTTLTRLCLDGNRFASAAHTASHDTCDSARRAAEALTLLLRAIAASSSSRRGGTDGSSSGDGGRGGVRCLGLAHNDGIAWLLQSCPAAMHALAEATATTLTSLDLCHTGLCGTHVRSWAEALATRRQQQQQQRKADGSGAAVGCTLTRLYLSNNHFASVDDGAALGALLQQCGQLVTLAVDDHALLCPRGVAAALAHAPRTLQHLSCARVAATAADDDNDVASSPRNAVVALSPRLWSQLRYANFGDVGMATLAGMRDALAYCAQHAARLQRLVLWSRDVNMDDCLDAVMHTAAQLPQLCYMDAGVLQRFDAVHDADDDCLVALERLLVSRRLAPHA